MSKMTPKKDDVIYVQPLSSLPRIDNANEASLLCRHYSRASMTNPAYFLQKENIFFLKSLNKILISCLAPQYSHLYSNLSHIFAWSQLLPIPGFIIIIYNNYMGNMVVVNTYNFFKYNTHNYFNPLIPVIPRSVCLSVCPPKITTK